MTGSNVAFHEADYDLEDLLRAGELYLVDAGEHRALPLVPLIRMMPGPEEDEDTCYFFSRVEEGTARILSYHDEHRSVRDVQDPGVLAIVDELTRRPPRLDLST
jgi:hypothetical protein